jgi:hypothetical protein
MKTPFVVPVALAGLAVLSGCLLWRDAAEARGPFPATRLEAGRPRLFFRQEKWSGGLSVAELRARAQSEPFKDRMRLLRTTRANLALKWLITGDETAAAEALKGLKSLPAKLATSEDGNDLIDAALAYDWLHGWKGFSAVDRQEAATRMLALAAEMRSYLEGPGAHIFHTRMYAWNAGVGMAGLALHGDRSEGAQLFAFARHYYETRLLPARRLQGGAMHNGFSYGLNYMMFPTVQFLEAAKSAGNVDYFHTTDPADSDWLREMAFFLNECVLPDFRHVSYADAATEDPSRHFRFMLDALAAEYRDGHAADLGDRIAAHFKGSGYHAEWIYLFFAFHDPSVARRPLEELPRARAYSPDGVGQVFMRSDWSPDATVVHFRCGDYFENHGHFDQGSFTIYRHGALAMKTAGYWNFDSSYRLHYFKQAISANTVIFSDPADPADEGRQRNFDYQSAGTIGDYLAHKRPGADPCVETGDIVAFDDPQWFSATGGEAHFAAANVTAAWDAAKVRRHVRQLAFVGGRHLVVVDETETARPEIRARWLLHTRNEPVPATDAPGVWTASLTNAVLFVQPLLPAQPRVTPIGGVGRECEISGTNYSYTVTDQFIKSRKGEKNPLPMPEYGLWRLEIEHAAPAARRLFVTVLTTGAPGDKPPAAAARFEDGSLVVTVGRQAVTFKRVVPDLP